MIKPIRPCDVVKQKKVQIPEEVLAVFNNLIVANWTGGSAVVPQEKAIYMILQLSNIFPEDCKNPRQYIYDQHWLDVEDIYRAEGWRVEYDKPAYCESYPATFIFRK